MKSRKMVLMNLFSGQEWGYRWREICALHTDGLPTGAPGLQQIWARVGPDMVNNDGVHCEGKNDCVC